MTSTGSGKVIRVEMPWMKLNPVGVTVGCRQFPGQMDEIAGVDGINPGRAALAGHHGKNPGPGADVQHHRTRA